MVMEWLVLEGLISGHVYIVDRYMICKCNSKCKCTSK